MTPVIKAEGKVGATVTWSDEHHPWTDWPAHDAIYQFCDQRRIDNHVLIGDLCNLSGISRHVREDAMEQIEEPIIKNLRSAALHIDIIASINPEADIWLMEGNHEQRLKAWSRQMNNLSWQGITDDLKVLLRHYGECKHIDRVKFVDYDDPYAVLRIGKMGFTHGVFVNKHSACKHVETHLESVTFGHTHTMQMFSIARKYQPGRWAEPIAGYSVGHLMSPEGKRYMKGRPDRWVTGFAFMEHDEETGIYTQHLLPIVQNAFIFNGVKYIGDENFQPTDV